MAYSTYLLYESFVGMDVMTGEFIFGFTKEATTCQTLDCFVLFYCSRMQTISFSRRNMQITV